MDLPIPIRLIAELTNPKYSGNVQKSMNLMIEIMLAFPEYFDELESNMYWQRFWPLIIRSKKEKTVKF